MNVETADRLKKLRQKAGLSQEELAEKLCISRQAVSKWERGEASPDIDNLVILARLYKVSVDEILTGKTPGGCEIREDGGETENPEKAESGGFDCENAKPGRKNCRKGFADKQGEKQAPPAYRIFKSFPYPALTIIAYLLFGFLTPGGFAVGWLLFLTIPLYYSLVDAIYKKNANLFCYPVLATAVFLFVGMAYGVWHPTWVVLLTVPIYYAVVSLFNT